GLIVIWAIFYSQNTRFLSAQNITNLVLQITAVALISVGVVLVLLLGEIGLFQGTVFAYFGVPAFIVTLAGLLAWQGALLYVLGDTGTINITNGKITGLANTFYGETASWIIGVVVIVLYGAANLWGYRRRVAAGLADQAIGT